MARAKKQKEEAGKGKGSQVASNTAAMSIKCHICLQTFICTTSESKCKEHADNKHPDRELFVCFPHLKPA